MVLLYYWSEDKISKRLRPCTWWFLDLQEECCILLGNWPPWRSITKQNTVSLAWINKWRSRPEPQSPYISLCCYSKGKQAIMFLCTLQTTCTVYPHPSSCTCYFINCHFIIAIIFTSFNVKKPGNKKPNFMIVVLFLFSGTKKITSLWQNTGSKGWFFKNIYLKKLCSPHCCIKHNSPCCHNQQIHRHLTKMMFLLFV